MGAPGLPVLSLSATIRKAAARFLTDDVCRFSLDALEALFPVPVRMVVARFGEARVADVLRSLAAELISVRDLRGIVEGLLSISAVAPDDLSHTIVFASSADGVCVSRTTSRIEELPGYELAEYVRTTLKRYLSHKYTKGQNTLQVFLLDQEIERMSAAPSTEVAASIRAAVRSTLAGRSPDGPPPVILTGLESRRPLMNLTREEFPELVVLSYQELVPEMNIQVTDRISLT